MGAAIRALLYVCSSGISLRDAERRRRGVASLSTPSIMSLYINISFSRGLLQFVMQCGTLKS